MRDFDVEHEQAHAPDRRAPRHDRLPAPAPDARRATAPGRVPLTLPEAGSYRVFADFSRDGDAVHARRRPHRRRRGALRARCPRPRSRRTSTGYEVRLTTAPREPARGRAALHRHPRRRAGRDRALPRRQGHLVALREGDLAFLHVHPDEDAPARSMADVPDRGPLPPVPAVQARRPRPHRRVHAGGDAMSATERVELPITGMTCASCANRIERRLNKLDGVTATVNYATEKATVEFDPAAVAPEQLVGAVEAAGYQRDAAPADEPAEPTTRTTTDRAAAPPADRLRAAVAAGAAAGDDPGAAVRQLAVAVAEPRHAGRALGRLAVPPAAWANLKHGAATMDTLISRRHARRLAVVAVRAVPRRRRHDRHADELRPRSPSRARAPTRSTSRRRRSSRRSSSPAATSRRAPSAAPAPR